MNKFNPEAIVCADFSIDVVLFSGDLTPEECSKVFEKAVHEDYPIPMLNDVIILGTKLHYDANGIDVHTSNEGYLLQTYSYSSIDAYEGYVSCLNNDIDDDDLPF